MFVTLKRSFRINYVAMLNDFYNNTRYYNPEGPYWVEGLTTSSLGYATTFLVNSFYKTWFNKVVYFLPMLGIDNPPSVQGDPLGASTPLINRLYKQDTSISSDTGLFFDENVGMASTGSINFLDGQTFYSTNSSSFGVGAYICQQSIASGGFGASPYFITIENAIGGYYGSAAETNFIYGSVSASYTGSLGLSNHYAQVQPNNLKLYYSGSLVAQNTSSFGIGNNLISFQSETNSFGNNLVTFGAVYITDGTLTDAEVADFHSTIRNYLIVPTGKAGV